MKIVAKKPLGVQQVYDLSVEHDHHSFIHRSGAVVHNCAFVIMNEPVATRIPLIKIGNHTVTAYNAKSVEKVGGLKMDFLVINILRDIAGAIKLIHERHSNPGESIVDGKRVPEIRAIPLGSMVYDIWDLPEDQDVFRDICTGRTETVFQLNTPTARGFLRLFNHVNEDGKPAINSIEGVAAFTALDRPGPLDAEVTDGKKSHNMLVEFANRAKGEAPIGALPVLDQLLPETHGIIVYQEQLQRIYQVVGKTTAVEADTFRIHVGKKYEGFSAEDKIKDRETFLRGATESVGAETAQALWDQMYTFGQYGFNKSHAVSYAIVGYACAWLKHHYPLEWWTAVLQNAVEKDRNEIDEKFWRHCGHLVLLPDIAKSGEIFKIEGEGIRAPLSLMHGVGKGAHTEIMLGRPYNDIRDFVKKIHDRRIATGKPVVNKKGEQKLKLGYSALHRGVVYTLIISGAMDSLFDPSLDVYEKLGLYEDLVSEITGKAKEKIPEKYHNMNQLVQYQMRKQILPSYPEFLLPVMVDRQIPGVSFDPANGGYYYNKDGERYRFVNYEQLERLQAMSMLPDGGIYFAIATYIAEERRFKYQGGAKEACEVGMDLRRDRKSVV